MKLRPAARMLYVALEELADGRQRVTVPMCTLAEREGVSFRTIQRTLRTLAAAGVIRIHHASSGPSSYELTQPLATPQTKCPPGQNVHLDKVSTWTKCPPRQTVTPDREQGELLPVLVDASAEVIYLQYPRKVARTDALAAINKVLRAGKVPPSELLQKTQQFARATAKWGSGDKQFIPYPATWYNRGSYDDDPATWERNYARQGQRPATTQDEHANGF